MRRSYLVSIVVLLLIVLLPATPISQAQEDNVCAQLVEQALSVDDDRILHPRKLALAQAGHLKNDRAVCVSHAGALMRAMRSQVSP